MTTEIDTLVINVTADTVQFRNALSEATREAAGFSSAISRAFRQAVVGGKSFESVLSSLALKLAGLALDRALKPVSDYLGKGLDALFSSFGLARGGVVAGGAVQPFANGGVVAQPTLFPLARGLGLMGEAGAEAVLPLARGPDGTLGVKSNAAPADRRHLQRHRRRRRQLPQVGGAGDRHAGPRRGAGETGAVRAPAIDDQSAIGKSRTSRSSPPPERGRSEPGREGSEACRPLRPAPLSFADPPLSGGGESKPETRSDCRFLRTLLHARTRSLP